MNSKQWVILSVVAFAAAFIAWLAWSSRQPPLLPEDDAHASFVGAGACLECHGPEGAVPQSREHPLGEDCVRCHGRR
jgi:cytochrome c553